MIFDDYVRLLRRNLVVLVVLVLLGCAGGLAVSLVQKPTYQATTVMYVSTQQATSLSDLSQGANLTQQLVRSYVDIVNTPLVLDPVIAQLGLKQSSDDLALRVAADSPIDTVVLHISVTDQSPATAARIANAVGTSLSSAVNTLTPPTADTASPVRLIVVKPASAPSAPTSPNTRLNLAVGALVGLLLAVFIALLRNALRNRLRVSGSSVQTGRPRENGAGEPGRDEDGETSPPRTP